MKSYRDERWRREATRRSRRHDAERFIEQVGFAACLHDARRPGPSLYVAVCGRRDAVMPRNVQKDPEASLTWLLKDELVRRGKVYYAKLARGKAMFLAPRMIPYFHAIWGMRRSEEKHAAEPRRAGDPAGAAQGVGDGAPPICARSRASPIARRSPRAIDELQAAMIVMPSEVAYLPKFTYIWTLGVGGFLTRSPRASAATRPCEIARCFLAGAGLTIPGELARVTGLSRPDAGRGNRALVAEGYATMLAPGWYQLRHAASQSSAAS